MQSAYHEKVEVPLAFECGGRTFSGSDELWSQGQDSVTASVREKLVSGAVQSGFIAKFAIGKAADVGSAQSVQNLVREVAILRHLRQAGVTQVTQIAATCVLETDQPVMVMATATGSMISEEYGTGYVLSYHDKAIERTMAKNQLALALKIFNAGVFNNDQYHNIIASEKDGSVTFIDFGAGHFIEPMVAARDKSLLWRFPRYLWQFFSIIPERQKGEVRAMLEREILPTLTFDRRFLSRDLVLRLWDIFVGGDQLDQFKKV